MKTVWHYHRLGRNFIADVHGLKVTHVVQHKPNFVADNCYWNGELNNDKYFIVIVSCGVVMAAIAEREDELNTQDFTPVAYVDGVKSIIDDVDGIHRIQLLLEAKASFLPKFTKDLTFEEVMKIFMWEYASPTVEVHNYVPV